MQEKEIECQFPKGSPFKVVGKPIRIGDATTEITTLAVDPEGKILAIGEFDGSVRLFSYVSGKMQLMLNPPAKEGQEITPISCIRWKPNKIG